MARRYTGGFLSSKEQVTDANSASGIFTTQEAGALTTAGSFPTGRWTPSNSTRFRYGLNANLNRTPLVAGNTRTWTWSSWVKRGAINGTQQFIFNGSASQSYIQFSTAEKIAVGFYSTNSSTGYVLTTNAVYRDPSAWYHIVVQVDTTKAISTERIKLYVNGVQITSFSSATYPAQNDTGQINTVMVHRIGSYDGTQLSFSGYLSEVNFINGQALEPSYFGFNDPQTGTWIPKRYTGTYGTTGFYLPFNINGTDFTADYLVVAGGGGGGWRGGAGAGGLITVSGSSLSTIVPYTITVGAGSGGAGANSGGGGGNGSNSTFGPATAIGGGGGGGSNGAGSAGGSGGGGGVNNNQGTVYGGGLGTAGQGNIGGTSFAPTNGSQSNGGGGGGSTSQGNAAPSGGAGGNGGNGTTSTISGLSVIYAGGGGGGATSTSGLAGTGRGGAGSNSTVVGGDADPNSGSGGGGGGLNFASGSGGSGIVIIKVPDTRTAIFSSGVTYSGGTASGGYKIYTVTATSTTSETVTFS